MEGAAAFAAHHADCVIGFGGGAALDVAKVVGVAATHQGDILEYVWDHPQVRPITEALPYFVALPTTSGTGSEVGRSSVISENDTHLKRVVFSPAILARIVFADPELTLALPPAITALTARVSEAALKGYRTLAVARGPEMGALTLVGLVTLFDPPRPDAKQLIAALHALGVPVKLLTGDALAVASEIARGVGLPNIRRVADLKTANTQAGNQAVDLFAGADGFAEVYPEDKFIVVQHLQGAGHVTGMTGDGINDAPALRQAEVGIAVSTATDVAKGAASVVLTEPGLTNIVALVEQGRTIYQRILTYIINKISRTILKTGFVALAFMVTGQFVMSAFAMLLLVFVTDVGKIALATDHVRPSRKPETWNIGGFIALSVVLGIAMVAESLILLWVGWSRFGLALNHQALCTFSFLTLLYFAAFSIISARERRWFWATVPSKAVVIAVIAEVFIGTILTRVSLPGLRPLPWPQILAIFAYTMGACLIINDALKVAMIKWRVPTAMT